MNREEFIKSLGKGAAFALAVGCFGGCAQENIQPEVLTDVDFEIDLESTEYASLQNPGGYVIINELVVVARSNNNNLVAATRICSHEPRKLIRIRNNEWYCPEHGGRFALNGQGLNSYGSNGLTIYQTSINGNILRVFS